MHRFGELLQVYVPRGTKSGHTSGKSLCYLGRMAPDRESGRKGRALGEESKTETLLWGDRANKPVSSVRRFRLMVVEGPKAGLSYESTQDHCSIGSHPLNDLVIEDPTVSRFHCEVRVGTEGPVVRDLESRNGTIVDGVHLLLGYLRGGSVLRLGAFGIRFSLQAEQSGCAAPGSSPRSSDRPGQGTSGSFVITWNAARCLAASCRPRRKACPR
jgi:hypothetical protein